MPYSTSVKYFHSEMAGAPAVNGVAGSLIDVLDACLVNGFGQQTVTINVSAGVATVTLANVNSNPFDEHTVAQVSGASPSGLNGPKRVLSKTSTGFTFDATGIANGAATGTITARMAPAGWSKPFSKTNVGVYRSPNPQASGCFLRIDDTVGRTARVRSFESMSDVDTGTWPCPQENQISGGLFWLKANASAAASARAWALVADDRCVYLKINCSTASGHFSGITFGAGDFIPSRSADEFAFFVFGAGVDDSSSTSRRTYGLARSNYAGYITENTGFYLQKSFTGIGAAVIGGKYQVSHAIRTNSVADGYSGDLSSGGFSFPNGPDNTLVVSPYGVYEGAAGLTNTPLAQRGTLPGAKFLVANANAMLTTSPLSLLDDLIADRKMLVVYGSTPSSGTTDATVYAFDITGPWF